MPKAITHPNTAQRNEGVSFLSGFALCQSKAKVPRRPPIITAWIILSIWGIDGREVSPIGLLVSVA